MRFAPQFPNLPDNIPKKIYQNNGTPQRKKLAVESTPNVQQMDLIKQIGRMLPIELLIDPLIFPMDAKVLAMIAGISEKEMHVTGLGLRFFAYVKEGICQLQETGSGRVVCTGATGDLYNYAVRFAPSALRAIRASLLMGVIHPEVSGDLAERLAKYRAQRSFSKSLDKTSKIDELRQIEQDHTINKFIMSTEEPINGRVLHLGNGKVTSSSQRALSLVYHRVVCIDPRNVSGGDYIKDKFDAAKVKPGWDIVSDIAYGDHQGMTIDGQKELVEQLYSLAGPSRLVIAKIALMKGIKARAVVRKKPRPHNLEVICELTPDGDPLDDIYNTWVKRVEAANRQRNERLFRQEFGGDIKSVAVDPDTVRRLMQHKGSKLPVPGAPLISRSSRNTGLVQTGVKRTAERVKAWNERCRSPRSYDLINKHCVLPTDFLQLRRRFRLMDPGFPDLEFSFNSVAATLMDRGHGVGYFDGEWSLL